MVVGSKSGVPDSYNEKLAALLETETQMGELAALLATVADTLSHFPDAVEIGSKHIAFADRRIEAAEWPSFRDLGVMLHTWREQRASVDAVWAAMSVEERSGLNAPPVGSGGDPTRVWI